MKKPRLYPIESFGPEILAALIKGSKETVTIPFPSYRHAYHFTMRLSQLRSQMALQKHPLSSVVMRTKFSLDWGQHQTEAGTRYNHRRAAIPVDRNIATTVILSPRDSEFTSALKRAGITEGELGRDILEDLPPAQVPMPQEELADFLDQFTTKKGA